MRYSENTGGRHREAAGLPARPATGATQAREHLERQRAYRKGPPWVTDPAVLRRVRDALAPGGQR
ncbi:MAG TPA: hypothetical protein VFQ68_13195 [Streptosporangiaceae bacterium]|nr:hypothetical protein [Streptosporangiaceae bacterium]